MTSDGSRRGQQSSGSASARKRAQPRVGSRLLLGIAVLLAVVVAHACAFPDYRFPPEQVGPGGSSGVGGENAVPGGMGGEAGSAAGGGQAAGAGGAAGGDGSGGVGAEAGAGGAGGSAPVVKTCAEIALLPPECKCADYDEHAYFFCTEYRSWGLANAQCEFYDMRLARVDDAAEDAWIDETADKQPTPLNFYWVGGASTYDADAVPETTWSWVDGEEFWEGYGNAGTPLNGLYFNWLTDQPDYVAAGCMYMSGAGWEDGLCGDSRFYVCEWY